MMYVELVKGTMNNQKEARKEFKIAQAKEREIVAIDILEDAKCAVKELKCGYLLEETKEETVVNNIAINKGKIVKVEVEKIVPKETIKEIVKTKEVKIVDEETLKQLEIARKTASTWQAKANKLENAISEKDALIVKLKQEIESLKAVKEEPQDFDYFSTPEYQEYVAMEAERVESNECAIFIDDIKPELKSEPKKEESIKLEKLNVKLQKYSNANIFKYDNGYFIASPKAQEITWLPNNNQMISQNIKDAISKELIDSYKFPKSRVSVSPYVVKKPNAYFARVAAMDGVEVFSPSDIFAGYIFYQGQYFLFSYEPEKFSDKIFLDEFNKKVNGQISRPSKAKREILSKEVLSMYEEYKALITKDVKVEEPKKEEVKPAINKVTEDNFDNVSKVSKIAAQLRARKAASIHQKVNAKDQLMSMYNFNTEEIKGDDKVNKLNDSAQDRLAMMLGK